MKQATAAVVAVLLFCVLGATAFAAGVGEKTVAFQEVGVPKTDAEKRGILASPSATINGESTRIGYNTLIRSGDVAGGGTYGLMLDIHGQPVVASDGSQYVSNSNDFSSLLPVGDKLFMVSHFESRPGGMYLSELSQNPRSGELSVISTENIDFSEFGGLWVPCAGSVTPWNTHLGSEEYPPDARSVEEAATMDDIDNYFKPMARYFGIADPFDPSVTIDDFKAVFDPYRYGYPVEVKVYSDGEYVAEKRAAMGRVAVELAYVMPDMRTAYISDDGTNVGFFMFVADVPGDLSAGTLYAAKWNQTSSANGGSADLTWIDLGWARQSDIVEAVRSGVTFSDIFEVGEMNADGTVPAGFTSINTEPGHEVLRVRPGMEMLASRLETRRYAAMMGATTEFRKEEGITYDPDGEVLYVAMSEVARGMEDFMRGGKPRDSYDIGGPNHIRVDYMPYGAVYACDVATDRVIGSDYVAQNMKAVVTSVTAEYDEASGWAASKADVNKIANPDNITFLQGYNTLIIGEDTGSGHQNDMIWAWDVTTKELTRIQTTPYGSETTSPYHYPDINGFSYIMSVIQHPFGESDQDQLVDPAEAMAYTGYIGPMPAMD